jgi:hypothetical protein
MAVFLADGIRYLSGGHALGAHASGDRAFDGRFYLIQIF